MAKITIADKKILKLLEDKGIEVEAGRKASEKIEAIEAKIEEANAQERECTEAAKPPVEWLTEGEKLTKQITELAEQLNKLGDKIMEFKLAAIPAKMMTRHKELRAQKEEFERIRNKHALKVQKIKDRVAPLIKKYVAPHLSKYEDIETTEVVKGVVIVNTFDYVEEYKKKFDKKP